MLELTLKHVKALSGVLEQQQQKIMALQNDLQIGEFRVCEATAATAERSVPPSEEMRAVEVHFLTLRFRSTR